MRASVTGVPAGVWGGRLARRARRLGRAVVGRALQAVWVILPLSPLLGAAYSWWAGVR